MLKALKASLGPRNPIRLGVHYLRAFLAALRYGFPARKLKVIGITGTDGKTTTVNMLGYTLKNLGLRTAVVSTANIILPSGTRKNTTHLTSLSPWELQRVLYQAVREGVTHAVVEVSSHGLVQGRLNYTWPLIAGYTNLTPESLDYHGSMERYADDKGKLFKMLLPNGTKVLNLADAYSHVYEAIPSKNTITYNTPDSDLWVEHEHATATTVSADLHVKHGNGLKLEINLPGLHNLHNALCALGCCLALDLPIKDAAEALSRFEGVPGRMVRLEHNHSFEVYVDFTITPAAYKSALTTARKLTSEGRVLVMCSSCGNRMASKRPEVGAVCSELADVVVVTEDETYGEDPMKVLEEVWAGVDLDAVDAYKITDRRQAIEHIIGLAKAGDVVLLCGMGPFSTFMRLEGEVPWHEATVAQEVLSEL